MLWGFRACMFTGSTEQQWERVLGCIGRKPGFAITVNSVRKINSGVDSLISRKERVSVLPRSPSSITVTS